MEWCCFGLLPFILPTWWFCHFCMTSVELFIPQSSAENKEFKRDKSSQFVGKGVGITHMFSSSPVICGLLWSQMFLQMWDNISFWNAVLEFSIWKLIKPKGNSIVWPQKIQKISLYVRYDVCYIESIYIKPTLRRYMTLQFTFLCIDSWRLSDARVYCRR